MPKKPLLCTCEASADSRTLLRDNLKRFGRGAHFQNIRIPVWDPKSAPKTKILKIMPKKPLFCPCEGALFKML